MEFQVLDSLSVYPQPVTDVGVLFAGMALLDFLDAILIDPGQHWAEGQTKNGALSSPPGTPIGFATHELAEFSRQLHAMAPAISRNNPGPR